MDAPDEQLNLGVFTAEDFDAYLPNKWNSNMYTLERRRVKTKLETLGKQLEEELVDAGLSLIMHSSDEFPSFWNKKKVESQWLFFSRSEAAREELAHLIDKERTLKDTLDDPTPLYRHLFLGVSVKEDELEIGLRLHFDAWVDRKNFLNLCADDNRRGALTDGISALPGHYQLSTGEDNLCSLDDFNPAQLADLASVFHEERGWLFVGAKMPRDQVLVLEGDISDTAREVFRDLIPIYQLIAWSPSNDAISIDAVVQEHNEAIQKSRETLDRERAEREARRKEKEAKGLALKEEIAERVQETNAWRSREVAARRAAAARAASQAKDEDARAEAEAMAAKLGLGGKPDESAPPESERPPKPTERPKPDRKPRWDKKPFDAPSHKAKAAALFKSPMPATAQLAPGEMGVGAFVEVTKGFLKGRRGQIQEIDEKGGLKVAFGGLSSRLETDEITLIDAAKMAEHRTDRKGRPRRRQQRGPSGRSRDTLNKE